MVYLLTNSVSICEIWERLIICWKYVVMRYDVIVHTDLFDVTVGLKVAFVFKIVHEGNFCVINDVEELDKVENISSHFPVLSA